ncbi:cupin domain-containing protein [Corynebacterium sp. SCR221107]|uniref:cupin domain-containing protein n=1 Tax=Corynebacterium sp. SCR221107 TaxID=3017361 RepID=UPI0022EC24AC|nr:cupin domain-containing protein [Corynebacterium sp. SCR221107]WBT07942.1 cupin domain-containing protein [Corynebacterium sp. SCR221107]
MSQQPLGLPTNTPSTFGQPSVRADSPDGQMTVIKTATAAPVPQPDKSRPSAVRYLQGDGANVILFTFTPGQALKEHKAAHPITVECVKGALQFGCQGQEVHLTPGTVVHLTAYVAHEVVCAPQLSGVEDTNVLLLTMLTGEKHSGEK